MFNADTIKSYIRTDGIEILHLSSCSSTNTTLKELAEKGAPSKTAVIADSQSAGRGRLGKSFFSPDGCGLYMSILLRPDLAPENALEITTAAAVSTLRVIERYTTGKVGIKWVNDIYIDMKKVCGILTESSINVEQGKLNYAVLGIGLNLYMPTDGFPEDIADIASSLFQSKPDNATKAKIAAEIIDAFFEVYRELGKKTIINEYRKYSLVTGKEVYIITPNETFDATVIGINDDYSLDAITVDGKPLTVSSGDVSMKIKRK